MNITEPKPYLNQGSGYTEPKPWCGFTEVRHFGTPDKHGFSYHTEKCGCRESCDIPAMLNLAGENYLYRNENAIRALEDFFEGVIFDSLKSEVIN